MAGDFPQVHGRPSDKFGLTQAAFPTQASDDVTLTEDVAYSILANGAVNLAIPAFGAPHPRSALHKLVAVAFLGGNEGKVWYRLTFSKLPGHLLPGATVSEQTWGAAAVVTKQAVPTGTAPATGLGVVQSDVQPQDAETATATATTVTWPTLTTTRINERGDTETQLQTKVVPGTALPAFTFLTTSITQQAETVDRATLAVGTVPSYSTLTDHEGTSSNRALLHFIAGAQKTTVHNIVAPGTAADTGFDVVESAVKAKNTVQSDKTTTSVVSWPTLTSSAVDPEAHGATTTTIETVVPSGTAAPAGGLLILESNVDDTDGTHAIQKVKTITDPDGWPVLTEYTVDEQTGITIKIVKTLVDAGSVSDADAGVMPNGLGGVFTEFKPIDKFKTVKIESQVVGSLPGPFIFATSRPLRLPDTLLSVVPLYDVSTAEGEGSGAEGYTDTNSASASIYTNGDVLVTIRHGFNGEAAGTTTKSFSFEAPGTTSGGDISQVTPIAAGSGYVSGSVQIMQGGVSGAYATIVATPIVVSDTGMTGGAITSTALSVPATGYATGAATLVPQDPPLMITSASIDAGGTMYVSGDAILTQSGGAEVSATITASPIVVSTTGTTGGAITGFTIANQGITGFDNGNTSVTQSVSLISAMTLAAGNLGAGYVTGAVTLAQGSGTGVDTITATGTCTADSSGALTSVTLDSYTAGWTTGIALVMQGTTGSGGQVNITVASSVGTDGNIWVLVSPPAGTGGVVNLTVTASGGTSAATPYQFLPSTGSVVLISKGQSYSVSSSQGAASGSDSLGGGSNDVKVGSKIETRTTHIGPVLTGGINRTNTFTDMVPVPGTTMQLQATTTCYINIPASSPSSIPSGGSILAEYRVEQWRLGVWVSYATSVFVP